MIPRGGYLSEIPLPLCKWTQCFYLAVPREESLLVDVSGSSPGEAIWVRKAPQPLWTGTRQAMGKDWPLVSKGHLPPRTGLIQGGEMGS